jgi:hypothetical protein
MAAGGVWEGVTRSGRYYAEDGIYGVRIDKNIALVLNGMKYYADKYLN